MIRHQTIRQNLYFMPGGIAAEEIQVPDPILGGMKHGLPIFAALGNVVRDARHDDSRTSWHANLVYLAAQILTMVETAAVFDIRFQLRIASVPICSA